MKKKKKKQNKEEEETKMINDIINNILLNDFMMMILGIYVYVYANVYMCFMSMKHSENVCIALRRATCIQRNRICVHRCSLHSD